MPMFCLYLIREEGLKCCVLRLFDKRRWYGMPVFCVFLIREGGMECKCFACIWSKNVVWNARVLRVYHQRMWYGMPVFCWVRSVTRNYLPINRIFQTSNARGFWLFHTLLFSAKWKKNCFHFVIQCKIFKISKKFIFKQMQKMYLIVEVKGRWYVTTYFKKKKSEFFFSKFDDIVNNNALWKKMYRTQS